MVRSVRLLGAFAVFAAGVGCGGNSGHGQGAHVGGHPQPGSGGTATKSAPSSGSSGGISKEGLAAIEVVTAVAEAAASRAITKDCYAICAPPTHCDHATGLCSKEAFKPTTGSGTLDEPAPRAIDPTAPPTCGGLCLPGERCVVVNGAQDCLPLDKLPPRP